MRLMQAMAGAEWGGAEAFFTRLAIAFARHGVDQRVLIRANPRRAETLRLAGVDVVELPFGGRFDFKTRFAFRREIKAFGPDIVLTWMNRATQMCPRGDFVHVGRLGGYYDLKYYQKCDHLVGNTEDIVRFLVDHGWPEGRAHYLPNFVSADRLPALKRKEFYTPNNAPLVLALGRLHKNKAFDVLLEAMTRLPDCYLWLAGEGPLRAELEKKAHDLAIKPRVRFLGWRDDVAALFASADIFVCPSRHEPLGNVVIEAWAHAKPVVAADALGPGTLIEHGETGLLAPVDDARGLANAIKWLLDDPELLSRIATNGHDAYLAHFTEEAVVGHYMDFFTRIANKES